MPDRDSIDLFASSCAALGVAVYGQIHSRNKDSATAGFDRLSGLEPEQCDAWRGLAAAGSTTVYVLEQAHKTIRTFGQLVSATDVDPDGLDFFYDTGLYLTLKAVGVQGVQLAYTMAVANDDRDRTSAERANIYRAAHQILADNRAAFTRSEPFDAAWAEAVIASKATRWHDVLRILTPLLDPPSHDAHRRQAASTLAGLAAANLGQWEPSLRILSTASGPIAAATAQGLLIRAWCHRHLGEEDHAEDLLNQAYAASTEHFPNIAAEALKGLADKEFGIVPTSAARIDARTDPWDAQTEPDAKKHVRELGADKRKELNAEADKELASFVGMEAVKDQVARLESSVKAGMRREQRHMAVRNRSLAIVLKGAPGTGKTTVARVIAKKLCALGVLPGEKFVEVTRADVVDDKIGGSEKMIKDKIQSIINAGGGVLFLDEAYALTDSGSKNDFGPIVIVEIMTAMVKYAGILVVIVAGYADKMDEFLDSNEGLRGRFTREIYCPSYSVDELLEISINLATAGDSVFGDQDSLRAVYQKMIDTEVTDSGGVTRRAIDVAANARFAANLVEAAEEEREHRLDESGALDMEFPDDDPSAEELLRTITADDIQAAAQRLLSRPEFAAAITTPKPGPNETNSDGAQIISLLTTEVRR